MTKLWLPLGAAPKHAVRDEREELMQRLREIGVSIPGAAELEIQQLRDYVQWQEERVKDDEAKAQGRRAHQPKTLSREEVLIGLKEYFHDFVVPRRENRKRFY